MSTQISTTINRTPGSPRNRRRPTLDEYEGSGGRHLEPVELARVDQQVARVPWIIDQARQAGVDVSYLGITGLFDDARIYPGAGTGWVLAPVDEHEHNVVPRAQATALRRLDQAGLDFLLYSAHEVDRDKTIALVGELPQAGGMVTVERQEAAALVGPVPAPIATVALGQQLETRAKQVLDAAVTAAPIAGAVLLGILAAPFVLAAAGVAALATVDPVIFGAICPLTADIGEPALFFELVSWDW